MKKKFVFFFLVSAGYVFWMLSGMGCAQIGFPTGGVKDSLPPQLLKASPPNGTTGFRSRKIVFSFSEYIDVQEIHKNLFLSPPPKSNPVISFNLRTLTLTFRDTLAPSTTYSLSLGDAIRDINEGNVLRNFNYVFSTGNVIDSLRLSGTVTLAESGLPDSSLLVLLYRNLQDSAVLKTAPDFIARVSGNGTFDFQHLPSGTFRCYALKDIDGSKTYNSKKELFAFADSPVVIGSRTSPVSLLAYAREKETSSKVSGKSLPDKKLKSTGNNLTQGKHNLLSPLVLSFNNPIRSIDTTLLVLTDTLFRKQKASIMLDSTGRNIVIQTDWKPGEQYRLLLPMKSISDTSGNKLPKDDTLTFSSQSESYYGRLLLRFPGGVKQTGRVLHLLQGADDIKFSFPLTSDRINISRIPPGEYAIRILYDANNNGIWDTGDFSRHLQPEKMILLPQRLTIRSDWDNERDINY